MTSATPVAGPRPPGRAFDRPARHTTRVQVRLASYRDLSQVDDLYRAAELSDPELGRRLQGSGPQSPVPGAALARAWYILTKGLSSFVPLADVSDQLYVADDGGRVVGFIQAEPAPGGRAWQVLNLCVAPEEAEGVVAARLLEQLFTEGLSRGVHRFLVRIPAHHPLDPAFRAQGFRPYVTEQIRFRELPAAPGDDPAPWAPSRPQDLALIHSLYLRTAPHAVAAVEAPSLKQWRATFQLGWLARIDGRAGDSRHWVIDRGAGVVAWAGVRLPARARPSLVAMMMDPQETALAVEAVHSLLTQIPRGPTLWVLRHYESELTRAVAARGFEVIATQLLMVRDLPLKLRTPSPVRPRAVLAKAALPLAGARAAAQPLPPG